MLVNVLLSLIIVVFFIFYGKKKGFDQLETKWMVFTLVFLRFLCYQKTYIQIIILVIVLSFPQFRAPLTVILSLPFIIAGGRFQLFRLIGLYLYKLCLRLKMNQDSVPCKPTIFLANYPRNYIEYFTHSLFGEKVCLLVYGPAVKVLQYIHGIEHIISVEKGQFDKVQKDVKQKLEEGYHVFAYIEKDYYNREKSYDVAKLRSGMFSIAKNINATITPVVIDHIDHVGGLICNREFNVYVSATRNVLNVQEEMATVSKLYKKILRRFSFK
jgi:hypothetical protein